MRSPFIFVFSIFLFGCKYQDNSPNLTNINFSINQYAKHFQIIHHTDSTYVKIINYYQNATNETLSYNLQKFKIPIKRAVLLSSTYIGFFDALNELSSIVGIAGVDRVYHQKLTKRIKDRTITEVGYDQNILYEKIVSLKPDIIFAYAIGKKDMPYIDKFRLLGIPVVYTAEYLEPHPLGRAEWIKFFAVFFDKEHLADTIFNKIEQEYMNIKTKASNAKNKPQVLLNSPFEGIWYLPGSSSYMVQLINDAGGKYIFDTFQCKDIYPMNIEWVIHHAQNADVWLNTGLFTQKAQLQHEGFKIIKAYRNHRIFNHIKTNEHNGTSKFWEQGVLEPHIILHDLYNIFHNDSTNQYHYYQKLLP